MLNISLVLDKNFTSTVADTSVHRYDSKGGSDTLISEDYFYAANNVHTGNVNILIPITAYGYLNLRMYWLNSADTTAQATVDVWYR